MKMHPVFSSLCLACFFLFIEPALSAQNVAVGTEQDLLQDPSWLIGSTLQSIITQFGSPLAVYAVRGQEPWQDDVVFSYDGIDLYWYQNRVWQIGIPRGFGVKKGDAKETVLALLGEPLIQQDTYLVYRLPSRGWPLRLRVLLSESYTVQSLYVYRPDF